MNTSHSLWLKRIRLIIMLLPCLCQANAWAQMQFVPGSSRLPDAFVGEEYVMSDIRLEGGQAPYQFSFPEAVLPLGFRVERDRKTGVLRLAGVTSGEVSERFRITMQAVDANGLTAEATYVLKTLPSRSLSFTPTTVPKGKVGNSYQVSFVPERGSAPYRFDVVGGLPNGLSLTQGGSLNGTPSAAGSFSFQIRLTDLNNSQALQSYQLDIAGDPPVVEDTRAAVLSASRHNRLPLRVSGQFDELAVVDAPGNGRAEVSGNDILYTPNAEFIGTDRLTYVARNSQGESAPATINISVVAVSELPAVGDVVMTVNAGSQHQPVPIQLSGGTASHVSVVDGAEHGTAEASGLALVYSPQPGFVGTDRFTYKAHRGQGASAPATVTVNVVEAALPPVAEDSALSVATDSVEVALPVALSGGVADSLAVVVLPQHGRVRMDGLVLLYTPAAGFAGGDAVRYVARNAVGDSQPATIRIQVTQELPLPIATDATLKIEADAKEVELPVSLSGGAASELDIASPPAHGKLRVEGLRMFYVSHESYAGEDRVQFVARNQTGDSRLATISIEVAAKEEEQGGEGGEEGVEPIDYAFSVEAGRSHILVLDTAEVDVARAQLTSADPENAGNVRFVEDQLQFSAAMDFSGKATIRFDVYDVQGRRHPARAVVEIIKPAPTLDESVGLQLRTQVLQAQEVVELRAAQVDARQNQLAMSEAGWGAWVDGSVSDTRWVPQGREQRARAQSIGADYRFAHGHAGIALGRAEARAPFAETGLSELDAMGVVAYAGWWPEQGVGVDAQAGYAKLSYDAERPTMYGRLVSNQREGEQWHVRGRIGWQWQADTWQAGGSAELEAVKHTLNAFEERDTQDVLLKVGQQRAVAVAASVRGWVQRRLLWGGVQMSPRWEVSVGHRRMDLGDATAQLGHDGFVLEQPLTFGRQDQLYWTSQLGVEVLLAPRWSLRMDYLLGGGQDGFRQQQVGAQLQYSH